MGFPSMNEEIIWKEGKQQNLHIWSVLLTLSEGNNLTQLNSDYVKKEYVKYHRHRRLNSLINIYDHDYLYLDRSSWVSES